jgi:ABC-type Fe3+ transport system substrate-binding protein
LKEQTKNLEYLCGMIKVIPTFFWLFLVFSFSACTIEEARPSKKQEIVIASDCLEPKDVSLLQSFEKSFGIHVKIRHLSADSLKQLLLRESFETEIDVVILASTYSMNQLDNSNLLHVLKKERFPEQLEKKYRSKKSTWAGIGIDPYVIVVSKDSNNKIIEYKDLLDKSNTFYSLQTANFCHPFYASILHRMGTKNKKNSINWLKKMKKNSKGYISLNDTIASHAIFLSSYSEFNLNRNKELKLVFPNQFTGGSYYNMACFGIVNQARNYENAVAFFGYLLNESVNKRLNNHWKKFPVLSTKKSLYAYQNSAFKKSGSSPVLLTSYHNRTLKILK